MSERLRRLCACRVVPAMFAQAWKSETIGDVRIQALSGEPEKSTCESKCFFQLNPPMAEEIPLAWDEICLAAGDKGRFL